MDTHIKTLRAKLRERLPDQELIVTHRNSLLELATRIIVDDAGKVVADGPREQVIQALQSGRIGRSV